MSAGAVRRQVTQRFGQGVAERLVPVQPQDEMYSRRANLLFGGLSSELSSDGTLKVQCDATSVEAREILAALESVRRHCAKSTSCRGGMPYLQEESFSA